MTNSYLRFLGLAETLTKSQEKPIDSLSKDILEHILKRAILNENKIVVGDIISISNLGSPATLHKRLHGLINDGYIKLKSTNDGRVKQIELTKKADQCFFRLKSRHRKGRKGLIEFDLQITRC